MYRLLVGWYIRGVLCTIFCILCELKIFKNNIYGFSGNICGGISVNVGGGISVNVGGGISVNVSGGISVRASGGISGKQRYP